MTGISDLVKDNSKDPRLALLQPKGKSKVKGKRHIGNCVQWTTKGQCSRGEMCGMKRDHEKKKTSRRAAPFKWASVQKEMLVDIGIYLRAPLSRKGSCKLAFKHTEKAGDATKKRNNFVTVTKTLDITESGKEITSLKFRVNEGLLHGVSGIPVQSVLQNTSVRETISRRATSCSGAREERPNVGTLQQANWRHWTQPERSVV